MTCSKSLLFPRTYLSHVMIMICNDDDVVQCLRNNAGDSIGKWIMSFGCPDDQMNAFLKLQHRFCSKPAGGRMVIKTASESDFIEDELVFEDVGVSILLNGLPSDITMADLAKLTANYMTLHVDARDPFLIVPVKNLQAPSLWKDKPKRSAIIRFVDETEACRALVDFQGHSYKDHLLRASIY